MATPAEANVATATSDELLRSATRATLSRAAVRLANILKPLRGRGGRPRWAYAHVPFQVAKEAAAPSLWERSSAPFDLSPPSSQFDSKATALRAALVGDEVTMQDLASRSATLDADERFILARWNLSKGHFDAAQEILVGLTDDEGAPPLTYAYLAICMATRGTPVDRVLEVALRSCETDPNDATALAVVGSIAERAGDHEVVGLCLQRIGELDFWPQEAESLLRSTFADKPFPSLYSADGKRFRGWRNGDQAIGVARFEAEVAALSGDGRAIGGDLRLRAPLLGTLRGDAAYWHEDQRSLDLDKSRINEIKTRMMPNGLSNSSVAGLSFDGSRAIVQFTVINAGVLSFFWDNEARRDDWLAVEEFTIEVPTGSGRAVAAKTSDVVMSSISDDGSTVVGHFELLLPDDRRTQRAFRWTVGGDVQLLEPTSGSVRSTAIAISANGEWIVGNVDDLCCRWHARDLAAPLLLGRAGDEFSSGAAGVSDDGRTIVGTLRTRTDTGERRVAFVWTPERGLTPLSAIDGNETSSSRLFDISADGTLAVGEAQTPNGPRAIVWTPAGVQKTSDWARDRGLDIDERRLGWMLADAVAVSTDGNVVTGKAVLRNGSSFPWTIDLRPHAYPELFYDEAAAAIRRQEAELEQARKSAEPRPAPSPWSPEASRVALGQRLVWPTYTSLRAAIEARFDLESTATWVLNASVWLRDAAESGPLAVQLGDERYKQLKSGVSVAALTFAKLCVQAKLAPHRLGLRSDWQGIIGQTEKELAFSWLSLSDTINLACSNLEGIQANCVKQIFPWDAWRERAVLDGPDQDRSIATRVAGILKTTVAADPKQADREVFTIVAMRNQGSTTLTNCFVVVEMIDQSFRRSVMHHVDRWEPGETRFARYPMFGLMYAPQLAHTGPFQSIEVRYLAREAAGLAAAEAPADLRPRTPQQLLGAEGK